MCHAQNHTFHIFVRKHPNLGDNAEQIICFWVVLILWTSTRWVVAMVRYRGKHWVYGYMAGHGMTIVIRDGSGRWVPGPYTRTNSSALLASRSISLLYI